MFREYRWGLWFMVYGFVGGQGSGFRAQNMRRGARVRVCGDGFRSEGVGGVDASTPFLSRS
jgi:hypothetical protein